MDLNSRLKQLFAIGRARVKHAFGYPRSEELAQLHEERRDKSRDNEPTYQAPPQQHGLRPPSRFGGADSDAWLQASGQARLSPAAQRMKDYLDRPRLRDRAKRAATFVDNVPEQNAAVRAHKNREQARKDALELERRRELAESRVRS